jgi:hypothetical protein
MLISISFCSFVEGSIGSRACHMDLDGIVVGDIRSYVIFRSFPNPVSTAPSEPFFPAFPKLIGKRFARPRTRSG